LGSKISFVRRNRITSGLSEAVLVCASEETGGAMIQTKIAWEQKRPIFCPALSLNIQPNTGISIAIKNFGAQEINNPQELIAKFEEIKKSTACT